MTDSTVTLDSIPAGADTVMTNELKRLFLYAACDPHCHACGKQIKVGATFKLVPHKKAAGWEPEGKLRDEMCCSKCGETELVKRDKREGEERTKRYYANANSRGQSHEQNLGYSRPSREEPHD